MDIIIINGPNLNLLETRETSIYGHQFFEVYLEKLREQFKEDHIAYFQSNHEGAIIDQLQESMDRVNGIVLNAGAYSHYSYAIRDAIATQASPVVEVHISNVFQREVFRHYSCIAPVCSGTITGFGLKGYALAIQSLKAT